MSRSTDTPREGLVRRTGPADAVPSGERLGVGDLTWLEVGEAVWLAAVTQPASADDTPPRQEPPPAERVTSAAVIPPRGEQDARVPPQKPDNHKVETPAGPEPAPVEPPPAEGEPPPRLFPGDLPDVTPRTSWSLPDRLNIVRALRPLKRLVASQRDVVIDEVATAERAVQDELWLPVMKKRRERWLDLTVVIDVCPSMRLWRSKVDAFIELLEQLGAFRTIRLWYLDTSRSANGVPLPPELRSARDGAVPRDPAEVIDRSGRRLVLVLTDGFGDGWHEDLVSPILAEWGRALPVSVIHLLPQWMWGRAGLEPRRARLTVPVDPHPNRAWSVELPDAWAELDPEQAVPADAVPVPVLELDPRWLRWWALLMTGSHRGPVDAAVIFASDKPRPRVSTFVGLGEQKPRQRIHHFRSVASPAAQKLARMVAAVPADLSVIRLLQENFLPDHGAGPEIVSELIATGILRYSPATAPGGSTMDGGLFDMAESDRATLLEGARRSETARVVRVAAHHHGHRISALSCLRDAIADPDNTPEPAALADRALQRVVLRALSGDPYLSRVARLEEDTDHRGAAVPSAATSAPAHTTPHDTLPAPPHDTAEVPAMSNAAERVDAQHEVGTSTAHLTESPDGDNRPAPVPVAPLTPVSFTTGTGTRQPGDTPPIFGNVPPRNLNFTGRADLIEQLRSQLTAGGTTAVLPAALHGMGGIGKTHTAAEYVYRHVDDYDLVWWINAAKPTQIRSDLTDLARHLGLAGSSEASTAVPAVLEALRAGRPVRRWLLVFDAAETPESVRPFFPANGPGEILVTSRNPAWAGVASPLEVAVFRREESKELLRRRGPEIDDEEADQVADKLGDLPLAIEQAAAWRAETGMPVSEYLKLFDEKVAEILDSVTSPDYEVSVAAAWNVSFDELRKSNPAAHQILHICAYFSPEPISRELFTGVRGVQISPELDVALRDPIQLARAIREINRFGLAKLD
ncbi:FxSxx-COOH system tetratricopeptide repeat protein, partial [Actinophytocola sp.]|uniref:FxSxx-COOH system tetratricopeptide repeat protein n=1 Tax=Actinophytocola sp. TaxID=1872138 RepID=UPI003899D7F4